MQQPTSAQLRQVRWKAVDRVLARYSTASLLLVLEAALASPGCSRFHDHLLLMWTRVLRTAPHDGAEAGAGDLPVLVEAVLHAAPGRATLTEAEPNDPRALVRFEIAGKRLLVHPGELDHPLPFLRGAQLTGFAVDEQLVAVHGFGLSDVLELVLQYTDHAVTALAPAWPREYEGRAPGEIACELIPGEVQAARAIVGLDPAVLPGRCREPERARRALEWLTADLAGLPLRYHPSGRLLGPVLAVRAHGRRHLVPVSAALDSFAAAVGKLILDVPDREAAEERLQELTVHRAGQLLGLVEAPVRPRRVEVMSAPGLRYDIAVISTPGHGLSGGIEEARVVLPAAETGRGRLVVYGGPQVLGPEFITDTAYLHVEEFAEVLASAEGNPALLAWFVAELTSHPGADAIFHRDPLDAWEAWRRTGTLLLPGPDRGDVVAVPPAGFDVSWRRATDWARVDDILAAAGLPDGLHWRSARRVGPDPDIPGQHADLLYPGSNESAGLVVRVSTTPPLTITARPCTEPGAALDLEAMAGLADSIRATLTASPVLAGHLTMPDGTPVVVDLTEAPNPHSASSTEPGENEADGNTPQAGEEERLLLHAGADPGTARIGIEIDPRLLAAFTGDGRTGHHVLGLLLHHLTDQIRHGRDAGPGTEVEAFMAAWDAAHPVLRLTAATTYWPAAAPRYTLPRSRHLHARALRTAAAAVRNAGMPAGAWHGPDAYATGGPGEQLLHALETELDRQIRSHEPRLLTELARNLNAAWAERTRGMHEAMVNLAAPWGENWEQEAGRRQVEAATATSALELLLQHAIAHPPTGDWPADTLAVADLVALAELVLHCGTTAVAASRLLHDLRLTIDSSGVFTLTSDNQDQERPDDGDATLVHLGFDAAAYQAARHKRFLAQARTAQPDPDGPAADPAALLGVTVRAPAPFTSPRLPVSSPLARADQLLYQHWGFGFAALHAVLATAADWPTDSDGIATVTASDLAVEATAWSGLPGADIEAAIDRLRLHPGNAAPTLPHAYTEVERRPRPATHPLIDHAGNLILLPWLLTNTQDLFGAYIDEGRLPHPDLPPSVRDALHRHGQRLDRQLESDIEAVARAAGLPHCARLLEKTAAQHGIPDLKGEIDLLVADPTTARLWVIEAKNPDGAVAPHNLRQHVKRFTERYRDKLLAKASTISAHAAAAARICGTPGDRDWTVIALLVTSTIEPAAFLAEPKVAYTTADHLHQLLIDPRTPRPGWNSPDDHAPCPGPATPSLRCRCPRRPSV